MIFLFSEYVLFLVCLFLLFGSVFISFKLRFVQLRLFPLLLKLLKNTFSQKATESSSHMIAPHKALFTAMSTTLGIGTIVAPVIAISLGGPGALLGFLLTSFFGAAATFAEVSLSLQHRTTLPSGIIMGGPMQYLKTLLSPAAAKWYALCCMVLMMAWSGAQANQLTALLDSPLLGGFRVPCALSGGLIALFVLLILMGGINRIGSFSAKIVPLMFLFYVGSCLWIVGANLDKMGGIFRAMVSSLLSPLPLATGICIGGVVSSLRWGIFKAMQTSEAGIGTQTIPHSMAAVENPEAQATLAMLSTYTAGFIAFLSGCVALITQTWQDSQLPLGMSMVAASFHLYFSYFGVGIITLCSLLFGFGTILGNSYNGSQCYAYLTENKKAWGYLLATALMIFIGSISETKTFWSFIDIILACMALPHMTALMLYAHRQKHSLKLPNINNI
ncbi:MAG TPA: alanine:cation symporter family protein [Rhabdochlamydiaceae bacterium]|jgi:AGCS family alanine or glycine:cation symporter